MSRSKLFLYAFVFLCQARVLLSIVTQTRAYFGTVDPKRQIFLQLSALSEQVPAGASLLYRRGHPREARPGADFFVQFCLAPAITRTKGDPESPAYLLLEGLTAPENYSLLQSSGPYLLYRAPAP